MMFAIPAAHRHETHSDTSDECRGFWADLLKRRAAETPDEVVFRFLAFGRGESLQEDCLTFSQLLLRARSVAAYLQQHELAGENVLLAYPPGLEFIISLFGCMLSGAVGIALPAPTTPRPDDRLRSVIADAKPRLALTSAGSREMLQQALVGSGVDCVSSDEIGDEFADCWHDPRISDQELALLQFTSGSTASPKGVMVSHGNLRMAGHSSAEGVGQTPETTYVVWMPLYHVAGLFCGIILPLLRGRGTVFLSPVAFVESPVRWLQALSRFRATHSIGPNFAFDICCDRITEAEAAQLDLSRWEVAICGAEPVRSTTMKRFAERFAPCGFRNEAIVPAYGMTEATLRISSNPIGRGIRVLHVDAAELSYGRIKAAPTDDPNARELISCGHDNPTARVTIVDHQTRCPLPDERVGEIWVQGASVAQGYWQLDSATAETFGGICADADRGRFLRTGDLGFLWDGELFLTGRCKEMILIRGQNHFPQDIEQTVSKCHPLVQPNAGAAFGVEIDGEEELVLVQEVSGGVHDPNQLQDALTAIVRSIAKGHELRVHEVVLLAAGGVPRTSTGKIQRQPCKQRYLRGELQPLSTWRRNGKPAAQNTNASENGRPAISPVDGESHLRSCLARVAMSPAESFDSTATLPDLGLDSMMMVELKLLVEQQTGIEIPNVLLLEQPTLARLAAYLTRRLIDRATAPKDSGPRLICLQPKGSLSPLFIVPAGDGDLLAFRDIAHKLNVDRPVYGLEPPRERLELAQWLDRASAAIRTVQSAGGYCLVGYSTGGILSLELARRFNEQQQTVDALVLLDAPVRIPFWARPLIETVQACRIERFLRWRAPLGLRVIFHGILDQGLDMNTWTVRGHRIKPYAGKTLLVRAQRSWFNWYTLGQTESMWRRLLGENLHVKWVPGTHYRMLRNEASSIVKVLQDVLTSAK